MAIFEGKEVPAGATYYAYHIFYKRRALIGEQDKVWEWVYRGGGQWVTNECPFSHLVDNFKKDLLPPEFQIDAWLEENKDD